MLIEREIQWQNPYMWVDETDLLDEHGRMSVRRGVDALTDTMVNRPTDTRVMARGLRAAVRAARLTRAQAEGLTLAREAMQMGLTPSMHIAAVRGVTARAAQRMLKRIDGRLEAKMFAFGKNFAIEYNAGTQPMISEKDIQRVLAGLRVECAGCGKPGQNVRYCLCRGCVETYGIAGEREERTRRWLDPLIKEARRMARKEAIEILMKATLRHGIE